MEVKQPVYKVISALLDYPTEDIFIQFSEMQTIVSESKLPRKLKEEITALMNKIASKELLDLEEEYVEIFEHNRSNSLYLFEHLYSDSKERGPAMLELKEIYKTIGLSFSAAELPDYIPMFLEYLSVLDKVKAESLLNESINTFGVLEARFIHNESDFKCLFSALLALATQKPSSEYIKNTLENIKEKSIDDEWLEPEAFPSKKSKGQNDVSGCFMSSLDKGKIVRGVK